MCVLFEVPGGAAFFSPSNELAQAGVDGSIAGEMPGDIGRQAHERGAAPVPRSEFAASVALRF